MKRIAHGIQGVIGLLCLLPAIAMAGSGWTGYSQITEITATSQTHYRVTLRSTDNPSGCRNKRVFYQDYSSFGAEQMFQLLLEAVRSGKKVRLFVTGVCELNGYSEISSVSLVS